MKKTNGKVTLTRKQYERLIREEAMLQALKEAGVDNWDGYSVAMQMVEDRGCLASTARCLKAVSDLSDGDTPTEKQVATLLHELARRGILEDEEWPC